MRKFEKISKEQYEKDLKGKCEYEDISYQLDQQNILQDMTLKVQSNLNLILEK